MAGTRKIVAIVAGDVVGFSRMASADEIGTLARLRAFWTDTVQPAVVGHGGRVFKRTGDGFLAEFGSAVEAVRCAVSIQQSAAESRRAAIDGRGLDLRIGVHVGDVAVEPDGDLLGHAVNVAARLEGIASPGSVCLSDQVFAQVKSALPLPFADLGPNYLKNIPDPIRAYLLMADGVAHMPIAAMAVPDRPSIAVLPFQNMSGDPEQEYFADGIVEDLITALARIKWMFVIARNSSFVYKNKAVDIRQVGRDLGVRYVMEGSVRKAANRLRITTQLIEAETGAHVWADKFDGALDDVFDLQDLVTAKVVAMLRPSMRQSEIERANRKSTESLGAYDCYLRALPHQRITSIKGIAAAEPLLRRAIELDPDYALARIVLAWCHFRRFQLTLSRTEREQAVHQMRTAVASGSDDAEVLSRAALLVLYLERDPDQAVRLVQRGLSLSASSADACFFGALVSAYTGNADEAVALADRALRLSPFDKLAFIAAEARAIAAVLRSDFAEAATWFFKEMRENPEFTMAKFACAAALALGGRIEEAMRVRDEALKDAPNFRASVIHQMGMQPQIAEKFVEGAKLLGLLE